MNSGKKSIFYKITSIFLFILVSAAIIPYLISGSPKAIPEIVKISEYKNIHDSLDCFDTIKVMTLNMAHGRGTGFNQIFMSAKQFDNNLDNISKLLLREKPHIAGFQEADGPSFWSGYRDQIKQVAEQSNFYCFSHGYHIKTHYLSYGTAMVSKWNIDNPACVTFSQGPFAPPKGFIAGSFKWPGTDLSVDVVVLHLDFISESKRNAQIEEIASFIESRTKCPIIIMGDFNSIWSNKNSSVKKICSALNLKAYSPDAKNLSSFPLTDKRIDWILVSDQLEFVSYTALQDNVSDHLAVISEIKLLRK